MNIPADTAGPELSEVLLTVHVNSEQIVSQGRMGTMGHSMPCMVATITL